MAYLIKLIVTGINLITEQYGSNENMVVSNGIIDHFELFTEKGFDSINLVIDYATEDKLRVDFPEISRSGLPPPQTLLAFLKRLLVRP